MTLKSGDNDALGVMLRYQDPQNYYRFSWDHQRKYRRLVKVQNGTVTVLAEDNARYAKHQLYQLDFRVQGAQLEVRIDGALALTASDSSLTTGSLAFYSWGNRGSRFDNLLVKALGPNSVPPPPSGSTLLATSFDDGSLANWTIVDEGTRNGPSAWAATAGSLVQSSNIYGETADPVAKPGTFAYYNGGTGWTDYQATMTLKSGDNDALGVMLRYQDPQNYYRFSWDHQRKYRRLVKVQNGTVTVLAEDNARYAKHQLYQLDLRVQGTQLEVRIDGELVLTASDSSLTTGSLAFYRLGQ